MENKNVYHTPSLGDTVATPQGHRDTPWGKNKQMENLLMENKPGEKKTLKILAIVLLAIIVGVILISIVCFIFGKIINISNKKGDSVEKFRKAYTAGIEVPDEAKDLRYKSNTFWWSGMVEVAFSLDEDEFENYLDEISKNYTLDNWDTDYGVAGMNVAEACEVEGFAVLTDNMKYLMVDNVDDYEVIFYKSETETKIVILASRESGRIYYNINAGG